MLKHFLFGEPTLKASEVRFTIEDMIAELEAHRANLNFEALQQVRDNLRATAQETVKEMDARDSTIGMLYELLRRLGLEQ